MCRCGLLLLLMVAVLGCSKSTTTADKQTERLPAAPTDPDQALYDKVRSGAYQISSAIDSIEEARKTVRNMAERESGATQKALADIANSLDAAGNALTDFGDDPPSFEEFKKDFAAQDDHRLKAIDAANAALTKLGDAQDTLSDLLDSHPPEPENTELNNADTALDDCEQTLEDAVKAMGGRPITLDES